MIDRAMRICKENDGIRIVLLVFASMFAINYGYFLFEPMNSDVFNEGLFIYTGGVRSLQLGGWASYHFNNLLFNIISPLHNQVLYCICLSGSIILMVSILQIESRAGRILMAIILAAAPAITGQMVYIYAYSVYGLALFFSIISLWVFFYKDSWGGFLIGVILMSISLGFEASYLGSFLTVALGALILNLVRGKYSDYIAFIVEVVKGAIYALLGVALYWIIMILHQKFFRVSRTSYAGVDKIGVVNTLLNVPRYVKRTYRVFFHYYWDDIFCGNIFWGILIGLTGICLIAHVAHMIINRKYGNVFFVICLIMAIPPCSNVIDLIIPEHGIQLYQTFQMQLLAPVCISIVTATIKQWGIESNGNLSKSIRYISKAFDYLAILCLVGLILGYSFQAYSSFRTLDIGSRHIKFYIQNALTHAIEDDEYEEEMPIVFMGFVSDDEVQEMNPLRQYSYYDHAWPFWKERYEIPIVWRRYCWYYFGVDIGEVSSEQYEAILNNEQFADMESYPSSNAYAMIDGCYVILMDKESVAR